MSETAKPPRRAFFYYKRSPIGVVSGVAYDKRPKAGMEHKEVYLQIEEITDDPALFSQRTEEPHFAALAERFPSPGTPRGRSHVLSRVPADPSRFDKEPQDGAAAEPADPGPPEAWF